MLGEPGSGCSLADHPGSPPHRNLVVMTIINPVTVLIKILVRADNQRSQREENDRKEMLSDGTEAQNDLRESQNGHRTMHINYKGTRKEQEMAACCFGLVWTFICLCQGPDILRINCGRGLLGAKSSICFLISFLLRTSMLNEYRSYKNSVLFLPGNGAVSARLSVSEILL